MDTQPTIPGPPSSPLEPLPALSPPPDDPPQSTAALSPSHALKLEPASSSQEEPILKKESPSSDLKQAEVEGGDGNEDGKEDEKENIKDDEKDEVKKDEQDQDEKEEGEELREGAEEEEEEEDQEVKPEERSASAESHGGRASAASNARSRSPNRRPKTITVNGVTFTAYHWSDVPDAPVLGETVKRKAKDSAAESPEKKRKSEEVEDEFEETTEAGKWRKERNRILQETLFKDMPEEAPQLPEWLNAIQEEQDDGLPGVWLLRPSAEDLASRFEEMLTLCDPIGLSMGCIKIAIPKSRLTPPPPAPSPDEPKPELLSTTQFLPLHDSSPRAPHTALYHVVSHPPAPVPLPSFPHTITPTTRNSRIPEPHLLARARTFTSILSGNPGGPVLYSTDNLATPLLRAHLRLSNPHLSSFPGNVLAHARPATDGIHTPYLYLGNPYTLFALHQEDFCASSLNYHHLGAPKMWRVFAPRDAERLEAGVARYVRAEERAVAPCSQFVRHASVLVSKGLAEKMRVRSVMVRQREGEMVVTWPGAYHQGWNEGANVCEAVAYGTARWREVFFGRDGEVRGELYRRCWAECGCGGETCVIAMSFPGEGAVKTEVGEVGGEVEMKDVQTAADAEGEEQSPKEHKHSDKMAM